MFTKAIWVVKGTLLTASPEGALSGFYGNSVYPRRMESMAVLVLSFILFFHQVGY